MGIFKMINELRTKKHNELAQKREAIRQAIIRFYEKENLGTVALPAFVIANDLMRYYCRTDEQVNHYYNEMIKARA